MLCTSPLKLDSGNTVACGQCMNCRINHKLKWFGRLVLEARAWQSYSFITLTFDDDHLPRDRSVSRTDIKVWRDKLHRLSPDAYPRIFAVGEYGEAYGRPHYHVIHFGGSAKWEPYYREAWSVEGTPKGLIDVQDPRSKSALAYCLGYVTKKMTSAGDERLDGRKPEFSSAPVKPTLGLAGLNQLAGLMSTRQAVNALFNHGFPRGFTLGGQYYPFFWRDRIRVMEAAGYNHEWEDHLQEEQRRTWLDVETFEIYRRAELKRWSPAKLQDALTNLRIETNEQEQEAARVKAALRADKRRRLYQASKQASPLDVPLPTGRDTQQTR